MIRLSAKSPVHLEARISKKARSWRNEPEINRWCRQYTDLTAYDHRAWLTSLREDRTLRMFTVVSRTGTDVGVCGLTSINHVNQSAEFSLYIAPGQQGKGLGRAALETLITHGFGALNLHRIFGEVFDGNPAMALFEKIGFKREGTLRQSYFREGRFIDSHMVSILRSEWPSSGVL